MLFRSGLRAHAQIDPLNAFKIEAFKLYDEFQALIRVSIARAILRVTVVQEPAPRRTIRQVASGGGTPVADGASSPKGAAAAGVLAGADRVGRNDPCPCGSGKKYKKCHGA